MSKSYKRYGDFKAISQWSNKWHYSCRLIIFLNQSCGPGLFWCKSGSLHTAPCMLSRSCSFILKMHLIKQCCAGAGAGGAEIIWGLEPESGPKLSFNKNLLQSVWRMLGWRKTSIEAYFLWSTVILQFKVAKYGRSWSWSQNYEERWSRRCSRSRKKIISAPQHCKIKDTYVSCFQLSN